jgi:ribose transport system permease protein
MTATGKTMQFLDRNIVALALVAIIILFALLTDTFFSVATLTTVLNQLPPLIVVTLGMTFVLLIGGIDLSVGSIVALSGGVIGAVFGSSMAGGGGSLVIAVSLSLLAALMCGAFSGWLVGRLSLPSFIVTLGMLEALRGLAYLLTGSQTIYIGPVIQALSLPITGLGVSPALIIALMLVGIAHVVLTRTIAGRYIVAIGTNEQAARISGINTRPYRIAVFAVSGLLAGLAGLFNTSYLAAADPNAGMGIELAAIAAAVIGGTSLLGGRGSVFGALIGVLIIAVLQSGLAQMGVTEPVKRLTTGAVIILAVLFDHWRAGFGQRAG